MFGSPVMMMSDDEIMGGLLVTWFAVTAENSHHVPNSSLSAVWAMCDSTLGSINSQWLDVPWSVFRWPKSQDFIVPGNVHPCVPKNPVCRKNFMVWGS